MRVTITIRHDGEEIEVSDNSEEIRAMYDHDIITSSWTSGEPDELIDRVVKKAKAAYHTKEKTND